MKRILFEIGTEEIPAGYIEPALSALSRNVQTKLESMRIAHGGAKTYGTPRRLAVIVDDVAEKQKEDVSEVTGPPEKVGFDAEGNPTMAAQKFAEKVGIPVTEIRIKETAKGRYLCADKVEPVSDTLTLLQTILPTVIDQTPFPKTMRWADLDVTFARPIQSILAIFGDQVVPFTYGDITSGDKTSGHRFLSPEMIRIPSADTYVDTLKDAFVIADIDDRRVWVDKETTEKATAIGGKILEDEQLLDIVKNLIEYPAVVAGSFDHEYLELPDEILITAMREHQKYFAVSDESGKLLPHFIVVNNTKTKDMDVVTRGHEKVLRARLSDAQFFYKADRKIPVADRVKKLDGVLFQAKLGTMLAKTDRIKTMAEFIATKAGLDASIIQQAARAAEICKSDLVSHVVGEFPKLQGVMGRIYAALDNEPHDVAMAVEEHYRPVSSGGKLPETLVGAILAMADKIDTICGCFSVGLVPTGASDPYALRRQSIGMVQILVDKDIAVPLQEMIEKGLSLYLEDAEKMKDTTNQISGFIRSRMSHQMEENGYSKDVIASVVSASVDRVPEVFERVRALEKLKAVADFEPIAAAFKRVVNIIKKAELADALVVDESLFQEACEKDLYHTFQHTRSRVTAHVEERNYDQAFSEIASMRTAVDAFFDGVMVMADDERLKNNRLAILKEISELFEKIADFSMIST